MATDRDPRIGKARLLRRSGKTYDEIRAVIGPVRGDDLASWLRGIPRPAETRRSHPMTDLRRQCRQMRAQGMTYSEIVAVTGVSKTSLSLWLRGMPRSPRRNEERRVAALRDACARNRQVRLDARTAEISRIAATVGGLSDREVLLIGAAVYWAEGTKSKPWRLSDRVTFINSDPDMIRVFMRWLSLLGVEADRCRFRVSIHESADVEAAEQWWMSVVGRAAEHFDRATLKRHQPSTVRYNVGQDYHGCLVIGVLRSRDLYRCIEGWWQGIAQANPTEVS